MTQFGPFKPINFSFLSSFCRSCLFTFTTNFSPLHPGLSLVIALVESRASKIAVFNIFYSQSEIYSSGGYFIQPSTPPPPRKKYSWVEFVLIFPSGSYICALTVCPALAQCWGERSDNADHAMMMPPPDTTRHHQLQPVLLHFTGCILTSPRRQEKSTIVQRELFLFDEVTPPHYHYNQSEALLNTKKNMHSCAMKISRIILRKIGRLCKKIFFILKWPHSQRGESAGAAIRLRQRQHLIQRQPHLE